MKFTPTPLAGVMIVEPEPRHDERGFFARLWCAAEFANAGIHATFVQTNLSFNRQAGTLRGMHFQLAPHAETKLVRVSQGVIWDVALDLRPDSPTFGQWFGVELSSTNRRMLLIPEGFAHGFQTLEDNTEVNYQVSAYYEPKAGAGVRFDDPAFNITWPRPVSVISEQDRRWPLVSSEPRGT